VYYEGLNNVFWIKGGNRDDLCYLTCKRTTHRRSRCGKIRDVGVRRIKCRGAGTQSAAKGSKVRIWFGHNVLVISALVDSYGNVVCLGCVGRLGYWNEVM
jgi:hypothetical protein